MELFLEYNHAVIDPSPNRTWKIMDIFWQPTSIYQNGQVQIWHFLPLSCLMYCTQHQNRSHSEQRDVMV